MQNNVTCAIYALADFAISHKLIESCDRSYTVNRLLDIMRMDAPEEGVNAHTEALPETITPILEVLLDDAAERGLIADSGENRDLFSARLSGAITPHPQMVREKFDRLMNTEGASAATKWFYEMCRATDYIRVDRIAKNVRFFADSPAGELEITINLSKPEKDPRDIIAQKNAKQAGYPKCMLCPENPGYAGRAGFPARQNHRIINLTLNGAPWHMQYSPYLYYNEHAIVFNDAHVPMKISRDAFVRLFDFVSQFPHYFLGSNADLPIVGGSILSHDHFQGGNYEFPMDRAGTWIALLSPDARVDAEIVDWPMTCIRLYSADRDALTDSADRLLTAWRGYTDEACGIYACTEGQMHNTVTPVVRKMPDGRFRMDLVLRNNRTSDEHPLGIFHPHASLHHIKKENIGLIEVMGLFILPGRLLTELNALCGYLTGARDISVRPDASDMLEKHYDWAKEIAAKTSTNLTHKQAEAEIRKALAVVCAQVLTDAGVYKKTEEGKAGVLRFLSSIGYTEA